MEKFLSQMVHVKFLFSKYFIKETRSPDVFQRPLSCLFWNFQLCHMVLISRRRTVTVAVTRTWR